MSSSSLKKTFADRDGISGSTYSSPQAKKSVMNPQKSDIYNIYWDNSVPKPKIMDMRLKDIWTRMLYVVKSVFTIFLSMYQNGETDWKRYWNVLTKEDHFLYVGLFLVLLSFVLYLFF